MSFLEPLMFGFALLAPAIVALYLLKLKRKEIIVPSLLLWRKSLDDMKANAPFQRLRNQLLMWLQLLIVALVVLAMARPVIRRTRAGGRPRVLLIDVSASMKAADVKPNRLEAAKRWARRLVERMGRGDAAMVVTFAGHASVRTTMTSDQTLLRRVIDRIQATDERTRLADAMAIAASVVKTSPAAEVILLSDGRVQDLADVTAAPGEVVFAVVGDEGRNAGVTAFEITALAGRPGRYAAFVRVDYVGPPGASAILKLANNEDLIAAKELRLSPDKPACITFDDVALREGVVEASLDFNDALAADNAARCVLEAGRRLRVLLVSQENYFLEKALALQRGVSLTRISPDEFTSARGYDVVIFDGWSPDRLGDGAYLFFNAAPPGGAFQRVGEVAAPIVLDWDQTHPLARFVSFAGMNVAKAIKLKLSQGAKALVETKRTPLIAVWSTGRRRVVVVGFDVYQSDWPLRVSFPLFISNAIPWLAGRRPGAQAEKYLTGQSIAIPAPPDAKAAAVTTPAGRTLKLTIDAMNLAYFTHTETAGLYQLALRGRRAERKPLAVNLLSREETDIRPARRLRLGGKTIAANPAGVRTNQEIWRWFALAALAVLLLEWRIYTQRSWL